ncbi:MAG: signal peptide peptidase SppA [Candidatus Nanohaloarchaea archaeon]
MRREIVLLFGIVFLTAGAAGFSLDSFSYGKQKAAVVKLSGSITPSASGFSSGITPEKVRDLNKEAEGMGAKAIVYEINSGGGAVVASKEVMRAIEEVEVPTVCRLRDLGASGAYLVSLGCDRIVADSATLTGSIGVKSSYLEFSGLLDRYGVEYVNVSSGKYKELGSPYRNLTKEQKKILKQKIERIHEEFLGIVDDRRNLTDEQLETVRTGEAFLGSRAKELGLVDELGGRKTAFKAAENITGEDLAFQVVEKETGFNLFSFLTSSVSLDFSGAAFSSEYR